MKFKQVLESNILDSSVRSVKSLETLIKEISRYKNKESKASSLIQSYLSGMGAGSGKSVHQHGNDIQTLVSAVRLYLSGDARDKKVAKEEYSKKMSNIMKRMFT